VGVGTVTNPINARKILVTVIITGIVIIASVGGFFHLANSAGIFNIKVEISGNVEGSNAITINLYVDGLEVATADLNNNSFDSFNQRYYYFSGVEVAANKHHTFQAITSNNEKSALESVYTPFGESNWISLNIVKPKTTVNIRGYYNGTISPNYITLQTDGFSLIETAVNHGEIFFFTVQVNQNEDHLFMVFTASNMQNYSRSTLKYIGSAETTIWLNLP
jgi:hypothetical protein